MEIPQKCEHRAQWEWVHDAELVAAPSARRLRCNRCQQTLPIGPSYDGAPHDQDIHWETIALDVALARSDRGSVARINADLEGLGVTTAEVESFWHGVRDAACGESCLTIREVMEALSELGKRAPGDAPNGTLPYAAGALAQGFLADFGKAACCATGTMGQSRTMEPVFADATPSLLSTPPGDRIEVDIRIVR